MDWLEAYSENLKTSLRYRINKSGGVEIGMLDGSEWRRITDNDRLVDVLANYAEHGVPAVALAGQYEEWQRQASGNPEIVS